MEASKKAKVLVVDSNAFIKQVRIETIGSKFYTIPQVISEIRDAKARHFLNTFPFEIIEKDPSPAALQAVAAFARKTGDYAFLSAVDLRVLALVYTLEAESKGSVAHLRTTPLNPSSSSTSSSQPAKDDSEDAEGAEEDDNKESSEGQGSEEHEEDKENSPSGDNATTPQEDNENAQSEHKENEKVDDDDGWITPDNIGTVRAKRGQEEEDLRVEEVDVGCFTTDYAMQSVLIQMGMKLLSVEGMVIKKIRQYVLKCHSCFKICKDMERKFCPTCGNNTMLRFTASTDDQGNVVYTQAQRLNNRGTIFSIPLPKGGRNSKDMILSEDVYMHKTRYKKSAKDADVFGEEYSFAQGRTGPSNNVIVGAGRKNPNIAKRRIEKKNKPISTM